MSTIRSPTFMHSLLALALRALRHLSTAAVVAAIAASTTSCAQMQRLLPRDESQQRADRLQEVQLTVMRYADEYAGRLNDSLGQFAARAAASQERLAARNWQLSQSTSAYTIASGPNPVINALDLVVLATLSRMVVEDYWRKELYGPSAEPLLEVHRALERQAWSLIEGVLDDAQVTQLHDMIDRWRAENPHMRAVSHIHFVDFAKTTSRPRSDGRHSPGSLFGLIGLDPLGNLDPAVRELEQTRQLAERTIYYLQRLPSLLDLQIERLTYQFAMMPETQSLLADARRLSVGVEAAGMFADRLPAALATEREAALEQIQNLLAAEQGRLEQLLIELRTTLQAGTETSMAVHDALTRFDELARRLRKPPATRGGPPDRPFDITEYAATARDFAEAARELGALVARVDAADVDLIAQRAETAAQGLLDQLFVRFLQLLLVLAVALIASITVSRWLWVRMR